MRSKRCLKSLFSIFLLILVLPACQLSKPTSGQTLHLNLAEDPVSFDPRRVRNLRDLTLVKHLFEGLTRLDASGKPQPALAERIEISNDLKTYTFFLRDAYWSDGSQITAHDFEQSWGKVLDPVFCVDYAHLFSPIKNVKADGQRTLIVELKSPTSYFLELMAFPTFFPYKEKTYSGPFQLKTWIPSHELVLEKNKKYWDEGHVQLAAIAFSIISDKHTEGILFEKGALDWLGQPMSHPITPELLEKMKLEGKVHSYDVAGTCWLLFNTKREPFTDVKLRKAFGFAIDRSEIISQLLQGNQKIATGLLPPCMGERLIPHFKDEGELQPFSEYRLPVISLTYPATERWSKIAQLIKERWRKVLHVDVELVPLENKVFRETIRQGQFQIAAGEWIADFNHPLSFLEYFRYRMNDSGWENSDYVSYLEQSLFSDAEKILIEEMPVSPLYHYSFDYAKKENLEGVILSPLGIADFKYAHFR